MPPTPCVSPGGSGVRLLCYHKEVCMLSTSTWEWHLVYLQLAFPVTICTQHGHQRSYMRDKVMSHKIYTTICLMKMEYIQERNAGKECNHPPLSSAVKLILASILLRSWSRSLTLSSGTAVQASSMYRFQNGSCTSKVDRTRFFTSCMRFATGPDTGDPIPFQMFAGIHAMEGEEGGIEENSRRPSNSSMLRIVWD